MKFPRLPALAGLLFLTATLTCAQDSLVGVGYMHASGTLIRSACPVGTFSASHPLTGEYRVTLEAPGRFSGAGVGDFLAHATARAGTSSDRAVTAEIASVSADEVTVVFYVSDLEDSADPSGPAPSNHSFHFAIHRFPGAGNAVPASSRHLFAAGGFEPDGVLLHTAVSQGYHLETARIGEGDYALTITKPGAFTNLGVVDFLPLASPRNAIMTQDNVAVATVASVNDDQVVVTFNTADVQNASNNNPVPEDCGVDFVLYRLSGEVPEPESALMLAMASVQGNGLLRRGASSLPGAYLTAERSEPGRYFLSLNSPGAFVGRHKNEFSIQVTMNNGSHMDRIATILPHTVQPDYLLFQVRINDVENNGENSGVLEDNDFFVTVHDSVATSQPDLRLGKKPAAMRGDNVHNLTGARQRIRLNCGASGSTRVHFGLQNDGNVSQPLGVRGRPGSALRKSRCFQIAGGRKNVSAAFRSTGHVTGTVPPAATVRYLLEVRVPAATPGGRTRIRLHARDGAAGPIRDSAIAEILGAP